MPDAGNSIHPDGDPFERTCDEFEAAWQRATEGRSDRPRIEDCLSGFETPDRAKLLRELLFVEWEYRRRREPLQPDEYTARFEEDAAVVREAFREFNARPRDGTQRAAGTLDPEIPVRRYGHLGRRIEGMGSRPN